MILSTMKLTSRVTLTGFPCLARFSTLEAAAR
jgi:hypothetical protein